MNKKIKYLSTLDAIIQILKYFLLAFGTIWLLIEFPSSVNNEVKLYIESFGKNILYISVALSLIFGIYRAYPKTSIKKEFKASNTSIEIKVGDIFAEKNNIAIGSSDYFDTNQYINANLSLKSQVISKCFNSDLKYVDNLIQNSIDKQSILGEIDSTRIKGKNKRYPIGSTVILPHNDRKIFIVVITKLIFESNWEYATSNPQLLNQALNKLWEIVKSEGRMKPLAIPVFGSGLARVNLSYLLLIQLIILSFVTYSKNTRITEQLTIIVYEKNYKPSDFEELKKFLDSMEI